jgi:LmbE family N-acetylglucosaminyl deacetylase
MIDLSSLGVDSIWFKKDPGPQRMLGVFAHPDDETFGPGATLVRYAQEGVDVHILTMTDGAAGDQLTTLPDGVRSLAELRHRELQCAVQMLGVAGLHTLCYRDSGMEGTPANHHPDSLYQAAPDQVIRQIVGMIRALRPQVVLTHDPTGGYFHPDHIRTCQLTTAAFKVAGQADRFADVGGPFTPDFLYYTVLPRSRVRTTIWLARLMFRDPHRWGRNGDIDLTRLGTPDSQISVRVNVADQLKMRLEASACHGSQGGSNRPPTLWSRVFQRRLGGISPWDNFIQAYPPVSPGTHVKADLFSRNGKG